MLTYYNNGLCDYSNDSFPVRKREIWEFQCNLSGRLAPLLPGNGAPPSLRERTLWVFPPGHEHGWVAEGEVERIVFHFTSVPEELESHVPARGYYRVGLGDTDGERIQLLGEETEEFARRPTKLLFLHTRTLVGKLSLMALREVHQPPLSTSEIAQNRTERALAFYSQHLAENPRLEDVADTVHVSASHLRRLFHQVRGEGPHEAFNHLRMEKAEQLLRETDYPLERLAPQLGFSAASALSRAVKAHFGRTPGELRGEAQPMRPHGGGSS